MPPQTTVADILATQQAQSPEAIAQRVQEADSALKSQQLDNIHSAVLESAKALIAYMDGKVTKTEVVNQLQQIGTPDALKVVEAVNSLHNTLKTHQNTDLSEITAVMRAVLEEARKIPKTLPEAPKFTQNDYSKQFSGLIDAVQSVERVVKAQKLIAQAPVVNVDAPQVKVDAPDLSPLQADIRSVVEAVKSIAIPEPKEVDNSGLEKLLKSMDSRLKDLPGQMPSFGGGSVGRASPYEDSTGGMQFVTLVNGALPTVDKAFAIQIDDASSTLSYIGKALPGTATSAASWQIKKIDSTSGTSITWASGNSNFSQVWDNRASLSYS